MVLKIVIKNLNTKISIEADAVDVGTVSDFGNGAKIDSKKRFRNRDVLVIVPKKGYKITTDKSLSD